VISVLGKRRKKSVCIVVVILEVITVVILIILANSVEETIVPGMESVCGEMESVCLLVTVWTKEKNHLTQTFKFH